MLLLLTLLRHTKAKDCHYLQGKKVDAAKNTLNELDWKPYSTLALLKGKVYVQVTDYLLAR